MMFKVVYQFVATSGRMAGSVRSGTVACEAKDVKEAQAKAVELIKNYGHAEPRIRSVSEWK